MDAATPSLSSGKPLSLTLHSPKATSREDQARKAAEEFEAMFIGQMLTHMFAGIETNEMFGGGHGEDVYRSMMIDEYGKLMSKAGGIGIADHVTKTLLDSARSQPTHLTMKQGAHAYQAATIGEKE